jgi:hypothetical protein
LLFARSQPVLGAGRLRPTANIRRRRVLDADLPADPLDPPHPPTDEPAPCDPGRGEGGVIELAMRGRRRVADLGVHTSQRSRDPYGAKRVAEGHSAGPPTMDVHRDEAVGQSVAEHPAGNAVLRVCGQSRVAHLLHRGVTGRASRPAQRRSCSAAAPEAPVSAGPDGTGTPRPGPDTRRGRSALPGPAPGAPSGACRRHATDEAR